MRHLLKGCVLSAIAMVAFASCSSGIADRKIELRNSEDSISFAVSMLISEDMPVAMKELGIDAGTLPYFVKGLRDAFPADGTPEAMAYAHGVLMAASAMDMLERADEAIYPNDSTKKVDRRMFLEGLLATAYGTGKTMTAKEAIDYYNRRIFRSASEEFIARNKKRPGVVTLPSGLQYKIESMGEGPVAKYNDMVSCIYKGTYPNGALFDSSKGVAVELRVATLVDGLVEALTTLPAGTRCKLYIPWNLAYGAKGSGRVPPYSALVYDLEIVSVTGK
ncbi:MAG: FKBP-type peptidyl-prolyl cis-trans isomerase [Bacteroidaceae bacterium]|nr:FKBP-type peptidyl-prolyl cis-trans isomerase [Bacteroidaceae bacterium]